MLDIVHQGEQILGDKVIGYQAANEPDLYARRKRYLNSFHRSDLTACTKMATDQV